MKVENKLFNSMYGLKKVEGSASPSRDRDNGGSVSTRQKSFSEIRAKMERIQSETGFQTKLDPRIAIALTVANSNKIFSIIGEPHNTNDIIHDYSINRGYRTDIEV